MNSFFLADFKHYENAIRYSLKEPFVQLRMRLRCELKMANQKTQIFRVLNEVVIDRGTSGFLSTLECYCDDKLITHVQADGYIFFGGALASYVCVNCRFYEKK